MAHISIWNRQQSLDALDDVLLGVALSSYAEIEGEELLHRNEELKTHPEFSLPPDEEKAIRKVFRKQDRSRTFAHVRVVAGKVITRVAVVFLVLSISFGMTMTVSAEFRRAIYKLLLTPTERYTQIEIAQQYTEFVDSDAYIPENYKYDVFAPTKMPAGYSVNSIDDMETMYIVDYTNVSGDNINFTQSKGNVLVRVDTENAQRVETIMIGDSEALLVVKTNIDGFTAASITWRIGDYMLDLLSSDNDADTLVEIAQNIKLMR